MIDRTAGWDTGERRLVEGTRRAARRRERAAEGGHGDPGWDGQVGGISANRDTEYKANSGFGRETLRSLQTV